MNEEDLFIEALEIRDSTERAAFLDRSCAGDAAFRGRLERLLARHDRAGEFLERPADAGAASAFAPATGEKTVNRPPAADGLETLLGPGTPPPAEVGPGSMIGPYKLLQQLGEGGMGVVFMAEQTYPVQRKVALKLIKAGMDSKAILARFDAERQALALMDHPNIAKVLDADTASGGSPYFVMELIKGVPITKYCDEHRLTCEERLGLFVAVCRAVQHAHQKGIIHRDIKPSNVMVCLYDGKPVPKVIDFGVAKATGAKLTDRTLFTTVGSVVGTLEYMSPEQAEVNQLDVDTRSDVYSLGVLFYELLTGTTPLERKRFKEVTFLEALRLIREEDPPRLSTRLSTAQAMPAVAANRGFEPKRLNGVVRGELDWIAMRALEKDRNRRYESANGFADDVQRFLRDEPVQACPPSAWYRFHKFTRRNRRAVVTVSIAVLAVILTLAGLTTSTLLIAQEQKATEKALKAETDAKNELKQILEHERVEAYYRRISQAHLELSMDNLGRALKLLDDCPEDLRGWEWRYLMRFCRVEPVVLRDPTGVHSIAFSRDGEFLASAGGDGVVRLWDRKGKVAKTIPAHKGFASSVAFHPDRTHLISVGADKLAKVWDLTTDSPREVFSRPCDAVHMFGTAYAAAFSPLDPNHIAVGCEGAVSVWNWRTGRSVHTFDAQGNHRVSLAYSPDGRRLASGNWRGSVNLWDPEAGGGPLCVFPETRHAVVALAFSPDGGQLATASFVRRVDVWEAATGKRLRSLPHSGLVLGVAFSPDGRLIASAGEDKIVHVWDAASGRELLGLRGHTGMCGCVTFSPDGLRLASASVDGTIRIWDATPLQNDQRQEAATFAEHGVEVWSLAVSPDGKQVVSTAFGPPVMIWDAKTKQGIAKFGDHDNVAFCVAWHPDGRRIAFGGVNGERFTVKVKFLDAKRGQDNFSLSGRSEYFAVAFSPDGKYLVTGNGERLVQVWDANNGDPIRTLGAHKGVLRGVVFSPAPGHKYLASMSSDGEVKLWDATRLVEKEGQQEPLRTFHAHSPGVGLNVAFSPDGKRLAAGGKGSTVMIWDVETRELLQTLRGHSGDVSTVAWHPDGRWVASAGEDSTVKVWDSQTGDLVRNFRGHTGLVSTMAFLDGRTLITGSRDRTIKFWNLAQQEESPDR